MTRIATLALAVLLLVALVTSANAATHTITWTQDAATVADNTEVERAPVTAARCGTFVRITTVTFGTLIYVDVAAPSGFVCYRARNVVFIDLGDGEPPVTTVSAYSNVDSNKPGRIKTLQVEP